MTTTALTERRTPCEAAPAPQALIVTDEHRAALSPLIAAIEATGVAASVVRPHPRLLDDGHVMLLRLAGGRLPNDALYDMLPLETHGDAIINGPAALRIAHHVLLSANAMSVDGVPHPQAFGCLTADDAVDHAFVLGLPVVVRPADARSDVRATCCDDSEAVWQLADALLRDGDGSGVIVQECVPAPADVHVLVAGGRVAGASLHLPSAGTAAAWVPIAVGDTITELAIAAVEAVGGDVMSAHVLVGADHRVLVADVNGRPPIDRFEHDAWARVAEFVSERCRGAAQ